MVAYRDSLARFWFALFEYVFKRFCTQIVVLYATDINSNERVTGYLLEIIKMLSTRPHCMQKYKNVLEQEFGGISETIDGEASLGEGEHSQTN